MAEKLLRELKRYSYTDQKVVSKDRFEKKYRHPEIDKKLRKSRTRREAKILAKLRDAGISAPELIEMDDKDMKVRMEHIPGDMVKTAIDDLENKEDIDSCLVLCREIGNIVASLHNIGIVHQDLTTSNMILHSKENKIYLIDFGLSFFSEKLEDFAVDLHLLKHALESRHHRIFDKCFEAVLDGYREGSPRAEEVISRLETVEKRGRNKTKN